MELPAWGTPDTSLLDTDNTLQSAHNATNLIYPWTTRLRKRLMELPAWGLALLLFSRVAAWYAASTSLAWVVRRPEITLRALTTRARGMSGAGAGAGTGAVAAGAGIISVTTSSADTVLASVARAKVVIFLTTPASDTGRQEETGFSAFSASLCVGDCSPTLVSTDVGKNDNK